MILGIDASNLRGGGGITHISEILAHAQPNGFYFKCVIIWGGFITLTKLCDQPWLEKVHVPKLDRTLPWRVQWQQFVLPELIKQTRCNVIFSPGGILPWRSSVPAITMSRNMLPFEPKEASRYRSISMKLKLKVLNFFQSISFKRADGLIFMTQYAQESVCTQLEKPPEKIAIIPHGISKNFFLPPKRQNSIQHYSPSRPFRLLYVSTVNVYKHQWHVVYAVAALREKGFPVTIEFVGSFYPQALRRFKNAMQQVDPNGAFINYKGFVPYNALPEIYHNADAFVFASSCENMPNILLEAMASGLPIACSSRGVMPELLGNAGIFFDPESPGQMTDVLTVLLKDRGLRAQYAQVAYERAREYSWERCARETFSFLAEVVKTNKGATKNV
ncbi:glycosyltransferase family 4 protein [Thermodesulfobacteriota bacterium]